MHAKNEIMYSSLWFVDNERTNAENIIKKNIENFRNYQLVFQKYHSV